MRSLVRRTLALALTIFLSLLTLISASSQSQKKIPEEDEQNATLIDSLLHQSYELALRRKYEEALPLAEKALATALKLSTQQDYAISSCFYQLAVVYQGKGELTRAEDLFKQSIGLAEQSGHKGMIAASSKGLADLYYKQHSYQKAKPLYESALLNWEKLGA
jgi:tetratricopeptide (TPR) repeat protein